MSSKTFTPTAAAAARWRTLTPSDLPTLLEIANAIHPDLPEDPAVFAERINLFPDGCRILVILTSSGSTKEHALGYIISHPILTDHPPSLNSLLGSIPPPPAPSSLTDSSSQQQQQQQQYYIHDLALLPAARGSGHAASGIASVLADPGAPALMYKTSSLVSVYGTAPFWRRFGFVEHRDDDGDGQSGLTQKLRDYGDGAVYMVRQNVAL